MSKSKQAREAVHSIYVEAARDRERALLQDRIDQTYEKEARKTEKAREWQRAPGQVTARRTGKVLKFLYYAALILSIPFFMGIPLIAHVIIRKKFYGKWW